MLNHVDFSTYLFHLAGFALVQIPELHVSVANGDKVGAVLREGHARHLTGHLVGGYHRVFLQTKRCLQV